MTIWMEVKTMATIDHLNYRGFDTRTFAEIFPSDDDFADYYQNCGAPTRLLTGTNADGIDYDNYGIKAIYFLLIANYANNHIASYDENRFKLEVMQIIYEAGPAWQKAMGIQEKLLNLTTQDIFRGSKATHKAEGKWTKGERHLQNRAQHPDSEPNSSDSVTPAEPSHTDPDKDYPTFPAELTYVGEQNSGYDKGISTADTTNTSEWTKDTVKGWVELLYSLDDTLCSRFIYRFKKLFVKVTYPNRPPLMYRTEADYD